MFGSIRGTTVVLMLGTLGLMLGTRGARFRFGVRITLAA